MKRRRKLRRFPISAECRVEEMESKVLLSGQGSLTWGMPADEVRAPGENSFNRLPVDGQTFNVRIVQQQGDQLNVVHSETDLFAGFTANLAPGEYRLDEQNADGSWSTAACFRVAQAAAPTVTSPAPVTDFEGSLPVSWNAIPNATSYELKLFERIGSEPIQNYSNLTGTSFTIPEGDMAPGVRYRIELAGIFADGPTPTTTVDDLHNITHGLRENLDVSVSTDNDLNVTVNWQRSYSTPEPSVTLHVYVNHVGDRPTAVYETRTAVTDATTSHLIPQQFQNGDYEVWARLFYADGTHSRWGQPTPLVIDNSNVENRPRILTPDYEQDITAQRWTISWTSSILDESYTVRVTPRDDHTNQIVYATDITSTSYTPDFDLPADTYTITVTANRNNGGQFATSLPRHQVVHPHGLNPIVITSGTGQQSDTTPRIEWDAVPNLKDGYEIFISTLSDPQTPVYQRTGITDAFHELETPLTGNRTYNVWVRATYDILTFGVGSSRWGNPYQLTIGSGSAGSSTTPLQFTQGAIDPNDLTPTLTWEARDNVDRYELWISAQGQPQAATYHRTSLQITAHELETPLFNNSTFEAWVRAHYADGTKSNWGSPLIVEMGDPQSDRLAPIDFTAGLDDATDATPELSWLPLSDVAFYDIYINEVGNRSTAVYRTSVTGFQETSHVVTEPLSDDTEYEFWIQANFNGVGKTRWGATPQTFSTGTTVPDFDQAVPELRYEQSNLTWDSISEATGYRLIVENIYESVDRGTQSVVVYDELVTGTSVPLDLRRGDYVAVLQAENAEGHMSQQSAALSFSIDFSSNQPVLNVNGNTANWDSISTATSYRLWVNEYDSAGQLVQIRAILTTVSGTSHEMNLPAGIYRGWLQAMNGNNEKSIWSEVVAFTIN